jgi:autotransporter-associated beta strand protein
LDSFTFKANDGRVDSAVATVTLDIGVAGNRRPLAANQAVTTLEETAKPIILAGTDADGNPLTYSLVTMPAHGVLIGTAPNLTYLPAGNYPADNFNGIDSFTFTVRDASLTSAMATVNITVTPVNDAPQAIAQAVNVSVGVENPITLSGTDAEIYPLSYTVVTYPTHGILSGVAPNLIYRATSNYQGLDSFTFKAVDSEGALSSSATVNITVVNDPPVAAVQVVKTQQNTSVAITLTGTDSTNDALSFSVLTPPASGSLSGTAPNLTYTPTPGFIGSDSFTFKANDGTHNSASATVSIRVAQVQTWTNIGSGTWSSAANWSGGVAPAAGGSSTGTLEFNTGAYSGVSSNDFAGTFLLNRVNFGSALPALTVSGNALSFALNSSTLPEINHGSANAVTVSNNLSLAAGTIVAGSGAGSLTLSGIISGANSLTKTTRGDLTLTGANTYTGGTVVSGGTFTLGNQNGGGTGAITLAAGSTFQQANFEGNSSDLAVPNALVLSGTGKVTLNMPFGWKDVWLSRVVSGTGGLTVQGGARVLTLTGSNIFSGGITLRNYTNRIMISNLNALGTGTFRAEPATATSGRLETASALTSGSGVANAFDIANHAYLNVFADGSNHLLLSGPITSADGTGHLHKYGSASLTLSGTNTYTGTTTVAAGILACNSTSSMASGPLAITGTAKLHLNFTGTSQVRSLSLGGVAQANGTYGSTSSPAVNKSDTWFSGTGMVTVASVTTSTALGLTAGSSPSYPGASQTFTATVTGSTPTGNVSFYDGATLLSTRALNGAFQASVTTSLAIGSHSITAQYAGDTNNRASTSPVFITQIDAAPAPPLSLVAKVGSNKVYLTWIASTLATDYRVKRSLTSGGPYTTISAAYGPAFTDTSAVNGTTYYYVVSASNGSGESANSSAVSMTPYVPSSAKNIQTFVFPGQPATTISGTNISVTVPFGTNVSALAPTYTVSAQATGSPISGTPRDFTTPKSYTITAEDLTTQLYTVSVTVNQPPVAAAQSIGLAINTPKPITLTATDVNADALTYTIVTSPVNGTLSGTPPNVTYTPSTGYSGADRFTFKANDGAIDSAAATVSLTVTTLSFTWNTAVAGNWNDGTKWITGSSPSSTGLVGYVLNFNATGAYTATHNLNSGFLLTQLNFGGSTATLAGNSLALSTNGTTLPQVNQNSASAVTVSTSLTLAANTTVGGSGAGALTLSGIISGGGTLTKTTSGNLTLSGVNTYTAGTTVNSGTITLANRNGLGTGPLTLAAGSAFEQLNFEGNSADGAVPNALVLSGTGNVILNMSFGQKDVWLSQPVSGTGGFTVQGGSRSLTLSANNTFSGGVKLTNADNKIQISHLNALGTGAFRSERATPNSGQLISSADLSGGTGVLNAFDIASGAYLNVYANSSNHLRLSGPITSAVGTGHLHKSGTATLTLSGANTYTGTTTVAAGILACNSASALGQGPLLITSGKLNLGFTGTRQVASLSLSGAVQANGTYGSTASPATNKNDTYFSGTGTVTVGPLNTAPVASAQSVSTAEDTAKAITLTATDVDLNALTYSIVTLPANGTLSGTAPNVTYTPAANYNGADSFTFKANDGNVDSAAATVAITVTAVNDAPVASAQSVSTAEGTAKAITLVGTDVEAGALNYAIVTPPANGMLSGTAPNVIYTPTGSYNGADSFTFKVNDGAIDSAAATVSITVTSAAFTWNSAILGNWSDGTKWATGVAPGNSGLATYILNFNAIGTYTSTNDLSSGFLLNRINLSGSTVTLTGNSLALSANGSFLPQVNQNSANSGTVSTNLALNANTSLGGTGGGGLTLSGIISGGSTLTKTTSGNLTLSGINTYSGGTLVSSGTLTLAHRNGLGTGALTLAAGTTFQQSSFEGNGSGGAVPNALVLSGTGNVVMNMPFSQKDVWLSQPVSGSGGLTVQGGSRSLTLTGNNTFSGGIKLTNADNRIQISHLNALGTGTFRSERTTAATGGLVPMANLSTAPGVPNAFDIASGAYLNVFADGSNHLLLSGPITSAVGIGHLHKSGTATLTLSGVNTYTGTTNVAAGVLACNSATALGQGSVVITSGKLSLNFTGTRQVASLSLGGVAQADGSYGSTASLATYKNDTYFTGTGVVSVGGDFTWNSAVAGNWSDSTKWTTGSSPSSAGLDIYVLSFNATGTYTSTHDLSAGFLVNKLNFGGSTATLAGNSLALSANGSTLPQVNQNSGNEIIVSTNLALAANTTLGGIGGGGLTLSGIISGGSALTKTTSGNLTLSGLNSYSGGTLVSSGTLTLANRNGLGTAAATLAAGTTFQQSSFEGNGSGGALPNALVLSGTGNVVMNMPFSQKDVWLSQPVSGTGGLTVQGGARSLTLTGNNTFSGGIKLTNADNRIQISHLNALGTGTFRSERTTAATGSLVPMANLSTAPGVPNAFDIASGAYLNVFADGSNHLLLSGPITSAVGTGHLHKSGTATLTLSGLNTYTGSTTVAAGVLAYNSAAALGQGPVVVTSGKLSLNFTGSRQVASLSLGGVAQASGSYGSSVSPATNKNDTYFSGTGTVTVSPVATAAIVGLARTFTEVDQVIELTGYETWATNGTQGLTLGVNDSPSADPDGDGISNLMEFALGGAPMASSAAILPTFTNPGAAWVFEYNRSDAAQSSTTQVVEYGNNLNGWTPVTIPASSAGMVEITPGTPSDRVKVTIPNQGNQIFVRLKVSR